MKDMNKKYFAIKLIPSRPTFAQDMTPEERAIMQEHVAYWKPYMDNGIMLVLGPVLDPKGAYGFGIVAVDDESEVVTLTQNDPATRINTYEYYPMFAVFAKK
jgi:uncharacterized protein YciI